MNIAASDRPREVCSMTGQTDLFLHQDGLWFSSHLAPEDEMFQKAWSIYTASFVDFERRSLFEHL
ncbi:MAG: hypothetical protein RBU24_05975, partial [Kiritimatiellia bacterium]|nr:hypothetical protein [Kiritimatiellia bacterium]